ncbi:MAG TPA: hypothetical protein VN256_10505 [Pyrinomonadaceae bacterium]|nr:hypothetical protein [Pyrinomonadaceae bacterium]
MSRNNTGKLIVRLFVFVASLVLVGADLAVSAQNSNSGTTTQEDTSAQNGNTSGANTNRGRRRRGRRRSATTTSTGTEETPEVREVFVTERPIIPGRCDPMAQEQTDLSGTYTGRVGYTDVVMAGDATLTISGNSFTLTTGQMAAEGRIVAVTTCNYTAVTMRFGKDAAATPGQPPPTVSLRARRTGGGLSLDTVPGESRMFSFHTTGASGSKSGFRGGMKKGGPPPVGIKPPTE